MTLAYRGEAIGRAKPKNRERVKKNVESKRMELLLSTDVVAIEEGHVTLSRGGKENRVDNDAIIICAGGVLPTELLRRAGVTISTKFGTA